jgi:hypothetical protein
MGYINSQMLFHAHELGVFDLLKDGPRDLESVANEAGLPVGSMERLLIGLCPVGLLERDGSQFRLSEQARTCLVKGEPAYVGGMFPFMRQALYPLYHHLGDALRASKPQWEKLPGMGSGDPFESLYRDEKALSSFQQNMFSLSYPTALAACEKIDLSAFRNAIDLGGGAGGFLVGACQRFPDLGGAIFDLPPVEAVALETIARHGLAERVCFLKGDFFDDPLPDGADMFVLGDILHNWSAADGSRLLEKIYAALPEGGAVCIHENMFHEAKDGPYLSSVINLTMLVATFGEQRTPKEFEA